MHHGHALERSHGPYGIRVADEHLDRPVAFGMPRRAEVEVSTRAGPRKELGLEPERLERAPENVLHRFLRIGLE